MADMPCSCCDTGFSGRAFLAYVNFYDGDELVKKRVRLCQNCIVEHFLPLVENADEKDSRERWLPARGERQWPRGANLERMDPAAVAREQFSQPNPTTSTFTEAAADPSRSSVTIAGSKSRSPRFQSSKRSGQSDSAPLTQSA
jgi:hypothetical protein